MIIWRVALAPGCKFRDGGYFRGPNKVCPEKVKPEICSSEWNLGAASLGVRSEVLTKQSVSRKGQTRDLFFGMEFWGGFRWMCSVRSGHHKVRPGRLNQGSGLGNGTLGKL
jgi:hypothetical protein